MKAWLPAVALGGLLAMLALVALLALEPRAAPTAAERVDEIARGLRCPDCAGLSVADSPTSSAQEIRRQIDDLVAGGATDAEVRDHFVARYGDWILLAPASPVVWVIPFAVVVAGAAGLGAWLIARRRGVAPSPPTTLSAEERRRLHEEAEALDA
ncbi:MAG TPA: cytochrome c-type biogenesis protein [Candidatus Limnocylindrales bacterium]|nr:cytochrome c-type biogenesis protein [Candidatus Limnocylindrales bacterium]